MGEGFPAVVIVDEHDVDETGASEITTMTSREPVLFFKNVQSGRDYYGYQRGNVVAVDVDGDMCVINLTTPLLTADGRINA